MDKRNFAVLLSVTLSSSDFGLRNNLTFAIPHTHPSDGSRNSIYIHLAFYIGLFRGRIDLRESLLGESNSLGW